MATQSKKEKVMLRQAVPVALARPEAVPPPASQPAEPAPQPAEGPIAQWESNLGDRFAYALWLICFALMALMVLGDTLLGWLFRH